MQCHYYDCPFQSHACITDRQGFMADSDQCNISIASITPKHKLPGASDKSTHTTSFSATDPLLELLDPFYRFIRPILSGKHCNYKSSPVLQILAWTVLYSLSKLYNFVPAPAFGRFLSPSFSSLVAFLDNMARSKTRMSSHV